jgi:hypothetical protein
LWLSGPSYRPRAARRRLAHAVVGFRQEIPQPSLLGPPQGSTLLRPPPSFPQRDWLPAALTILLRCESVKVEFRSDLEKRTEGGSDIGPPPGAQLSRKRVRRMRYCPFGEGPRVRIPLPPPGSRLRTGLPPPSTLPASPSERDRGFESLFLMDLVHARRRQASNPATWLTRLVDRFPSRLGAPLRRLAA